MHVIFRTKVNPERQTNIKKRCCILLPDPAAIEGKDEAEAEVEASTGESRLGGANDSEGVWWGLDGGCWMVCRECPPSTEGILCGPSKSYSSFTISAELGPELVRVSPDKSEPNHKDVVSSLMIAPIARLHF